MGASAGGLEAFQKFFAHMPPDSGMAFVLVQHLDPRHATLMPELLAKCTRMQVQQVRDRTRMAPDNVYVIPPDRTLTIESGVVRAKKPVDSLGRYTPIDTLFRSLAADQGQNAVCILFSGSGTDGTLGLRSVKEHGGMTMAQSPETAHHDSMVRSAIATGMVDHVMPPQELPDKLVEFARYLRELHSGNRAGATLEEANGELARICELLRRRTSHDFTRYKRGTLTRRIQRRMLVLQAPTVAAYLELLRRNPDELDQLFKDLLIGVTHFFRDPDAFKVLARLAVPEILQQEDGSEGSIRVWIPGCATGEEAYSVAILFREAMTGVNARRKVQIFAGDIDDEALEFARQGRYPEGIAQHVDAIRLKRFFIRQGHGYMVSRELREMCNFSRHNLIRDPPFSRLHLLVCRNVLIYLQGDLQHHLASVFHYALRPGGFLFLGPSEGVLGPPELFATVDKKHRIFKRSQTLVRTPLALPAPPRAASQRPLASEVPGLAQTGEKSSLIEILERILLENYSPAWVVINARGEALYFSPRTGRFLEHPAGAPSVDLVEMARRALRIPLRTAIHQALKSGKPVTHDGISVAANGDVQKINLIVRPMNELAGQPDLFMVVFQEISPVQSREQAEADGVSLHTPDHLTQQLESELRSTKDHLRASIEELETSNEELKSSNEELQSSNEELQSTNEELQTSKEELQSVNEELETINSELSRKVEELDTAHSDLQNLFQSTQIPTLFLAADLRIKRFTQAATSVFRLIDGDVGRPVTDITPRFEDGGLVGAIQDVLRSQKTRERRVRLADGSATFVVRVLPYRRVDGAIDGVVLTFLDVTQLDRALEQRARLAAIVESSQDAIVGSNFEDVIIIWNRGASELFGYSEAEAVGRPISLIVPQDRAEQLEDAAEKIRRGEAVGPFETSRRAKDGREIVVSATLSPIKDVEGRVVAAASVFRDISQLKNAQAALLEEARRKDEFLALLSHELRNPLAPLRTCVDILRHHPPGTEPANMSLDIIDRQTRHLTAMVDQLLDISRITTGKTVLHREVFDLGAVVKAAAQDHRSSMDSSELELELSLPDEPLWVNADPMRLSQVLANLLSNAAKFSERGGKVKVGLRRRRHEAEITVRDDGMGMDRGILGRLFEPFIQAERSLARTRGGLGLGLALVKSLVEAHQGTVEARSDGPGLGSELIVRLPLQDVDMKTAVSASPSAATAEAGGPRRILVVEDNADAAESARIMLELANHQVEVAKNGPAALEAARRFQPDVVLCDIGLPGSMDGYAVAAALRQERGLEHTYLVALSGYGRQEDREQARKAGFDIHLTKPADPAALRRLLGRVPARP
jgi:two-component system CheB/CheR fusion protein